MESELYKIHERQNPDLWKGGWDLKVSLRNEKGHSVWMVDDTNTSGTHFSA